MASTLAKDAVTERTRDETVDQVQDATLQRFQRRSYVLAEIWRGLYAAGSN